MIDKKTAMELKELIDAANTIAIISHRSPDADTIGSNLALREIFENHDKKVISLCYDSVPSQMDFLTKEEETSEQNDNGLSSKQSDFTEKFQKETDFDLCDVIICLDAASEAQTVFLEKYPELLDGQTPVINIDHHVSNSRYGMINLVIPEAASTTLIIYHLLKIWGEKINEKTATALMAGLYFDTGSFMHSNTDGNVYQAGGELLLMSAKRDVITKNLFRTSSIEKLKLLGKILSNVTQTPKGVAFSCVTQKDLQKNNLRCGDASGAIDYLNTVKNSLFAAMLVEDDKNNIRGSFRTRNDDVNLSELACFLGGGGNKKASGFQIEGRLKKEVEWKVETG